MVTPEGNEASGAGRLPFQLRRSGSAGRLALDGARALGFVHVDRLELEVPGDDLFDTGAAAERYQRRRTQLAVASLRVDQRAIEAQVAASAAALALNGVTAVGVRLLDGAAAVTARIGDGLAAADVSFRVVIAPSGLGVRLIATDVRVHGHLPTPAPVLAHRILATVLAAEEPERAGDGGLPHVRGLCDVELEPLPALLWRLLPPHGWRLPAIAGLALVSARITRTGIAVSYAPAGNRGDDDGPLPVVIAHDAMHTADELLRKGQLDDAMRGYRTLLAAGGPDQPVLLARILAIAAARPSWFVDGMELSRQALGRWPEYAPAHATLASIALAKGDARDAAAQLGQLAESSAEAGDDDGAALAALAAARLLRVLDPRAATGLYELALAHHPGNAEAVDALAERYADEGRWHDLVRLHRARLAATTDRSRAVKDHLRVAELLATKLGDRRAAAAELERARELAPDDAGVHVAAAELAESAGDPVGAAAALAEVARLAAERRDRKSEAQAHARRAELLDGLGEDGARDADDAWRAAIAAGPDDVAVMRGAARARAHRGDPAGAAALWRQVLAQAPGADISLELGRTLLAGGDREGARAALADAAAGPVGISAEAHHLLSQLGDDDAASELDAAIVALCAAAEHAFALPPDDEGDRLLGRAALLALERAHMLDGAGDRDGALDDLRRAHRLAAPRAPAVARDAARALLARDPRDDAQREWLDALLATQPEEEERARLLVRRATLRRGDDADASLDDVAAAIALTDREDPTPSDDAIRADALGVQAEILAARGDRAGRAQALAARARVTRPRMERVTADTDAADAWLAADEPAAALPHAARAAAALDDGEEVGLAEEGRRRVLETFVEAAWRQRAWPDVTRGADLLLASHDDPTLRYRRAVAAERQGDGDRARADLERVLGDDAAPAELRPLAHRLLADLCERAGDVGRAAESLEAFAGDPESGASPAARADAWYRAAELYRRAGGDAAVALDHAARCLEGALRQVEDHLPALDALELVERALGNSERVAVILGRKIAASARRPGRQKALLARLAALQVDLGRPEIALEAYRRALEIDPDYRPALRFIADQAARLGDRAEAATLYERLAGPLPGDGDEDDAAVAADRASAAAAFGRAVAEAAAGDAAAMVWAASWLHRARSAIEIALELAPTDPELRAAADALAAPSAPATSAEAAAAIPPAAARVRAAALQRQGLEAREAGRLDIAAGHLAAACQLQPDDTELLRDWCEVLAELGDVATHVVALEQLARVATDKGPGPRKADVLLELADVCYDQLGDLPRARGAMRAAADAHGPGARRDATLRLLATETFARGEFAEALSAYEAIAHARRTATDLVGMATSYHRLGREQTAIVMLEEARAAGKLADEGAMLLFALSAERDRKAELAAALEHAATAAPPAEARGRLLEALALYRDHVRDPDSIERVSDRLDALGPDEAEAVTRTDHRADSGRVRAPTAPPDPVAAASVAGTAAAMTGATAAAVADAAVAAYDASAATASLRRAFADTIPPPAGAPPAQPDGLDDDWQMPDTAQLAAAAVTAMAPASRAIELEKAAAAAAGRGDRRRAADLLADALAARVAAGAGVVEALGVVGNLEEVAVDAPDLIVRALFAAAARAPAPVAVALLRRAAHAAAHGLGDDVIAADALARAHSLAIEDPQILDDLVEVLAKTGDVIRLADACERTARATTGRTAARAFYQLGLVHRDAFNDARRSAEDFASAHAADPDFPDVWLPLANALAADDDLAGAHALYERALFGGRLGAEDRAWVQTRLDALGHDPEVVSGEIRKEQVKEQVMAAVAQTLTDMMTAVATGLTEAVAAHVTGEPLGLTSEMTPEPPAPAPVRARTTTEDTDAPAEPVPPLDPEALAEIYERNADWDALTELLGKRIVATDDRHERAQLWHRRARLYRDILHREAETYRCLREAHACDPDDPEIAHALRSIAMARGEWALAAQLLYREIAAAPTARDRGALHLELALIFDEKLFESESARVNYEEALALDPEIPAAPRPLARIYELAARHRDAALMYERAAAAAKAETRAPLLLRAGAAASRAGDLDSARRLVGIAALAADAVDDEATAREAREESLRLAPADDRPSLAAAAGSDDEHVTALETALVDAQARGDLDAADRHASSLLDVDPSNGLAFRHLAGHAETRSDWPMLTALLTARAMVIADPAERATLWFEIGRVHELHRNDAVASASAYDRALEADPDHPGALDARATLAYRAEDLDLADRLYARIQPARSSLPRELMLLRRVAIAESRGRLREALDRAREAAAADGASREACLAAIKLGVRLGDYGASAIAARAALELIPPDDVVALAEARLELADLLRMANDPAAAIELYEQVLTDDPKSLRALQSLAELHVQHGQHGGAARSLKALAGLADAPARKAELVWRLGELHLKAGEHLDADDAFLRASDLDPAHVPTLRRLIDVYWRADEPTSLLDVANELATHNQLLGDATDRATLGRALVAATAGAALHLAARIASALAGDAPALIAAALVELGADHHEITLEAAASGLRELARKGQGPKLSEIIDAVYAALGDDEDRADAIGAALTA